MITKTIEGHKALQIFESFIVDETLPKHTTAKKEETIFITGVGFVNGTVSQSNSSILWTPMASSVSYAGPGLLSQIKTAWCRLLARLSRRCSETYHRVTSLPVEEVFEAIMGKGKKLDILVGRIEAHRDAIKEARAMGQIALADQLEAQTAATEVEAILFAADARNYIEEKTLIDFAEKCERGLRLDWVKNFTRLIPHDIRIKKLKMDALNAFDNYAVLHYDPLNKSNALTKKEIEKKKDPILFGVIKGSRKLYHVASWKDEYCDLTFTDLLDKYGKEALTLK